MKEIPAGYRELYEASNAVLKYRILRDVVGEDDSFHRTAKLQGEIMKTQEAQKLFAEQLEDGSWTDTPQVFMRLCEMGLENCDAIAECLEKFLIPALLKTDDRNLRDSLLRLILRARPEADEIVVLSLEQILAEWEQFLKANAVQRKQLSAPTFSAYAAVCYAKWPPQKLARTQELIRKLFDYGERAEPTVDKFYLREKTDYILEPQRMLYELELSARIGLTRELGASIWMFEELEFHQDGDGQFRFDLSLLPEEFSETRKKAEDKNTELDWYFPLDDSDDFWTDYSFRANQIFKLLEYDF